MDGRTKQTRHEPVKRYPAYVKTEAQRAEFDAGWARFHRANDADRRAKAIKLESKAWLAEFYGDTAEAEGLRREAVAMHPAPPADFTVDALRAAHRA